MLGDALADDVAALAASSPPGRRSRSASRKRLLRRSLDASLDDVIELEAQLQRAAAASADHREGVAAFLEKRAPTFEGR